MLFPVWVPGLGWDGVVAVPETAGVGLFFTQQSLTALCSQSHAGRHRSL